MKRLMKQLLGIDDGLTREEAQELIRMARSVKNGLEKGGMVSYESLQLIPFAKSEDDGLVVNERVSSYRLTLLDDSLLLWDVVMQDNSNFGIHEHDALEQLWVLDGVCIVDGESLDRFATRTFEAGVKHDVSSVEGCRLIVMFRR